MVLSNEEAERRNAQMKEAERRKAQAYAKAVADFPFERIEVRGEDALQVWQRLKTDRRGIPIVIGSEDSIVNLAEPFDRTFPRPQKSVAEILDAVSRIKIPDDLFARRKAADAASKAYAEKLAFGPDSELPTVIVNDDGSYIVTTTVGGPAQVPPFLAAKGRRLSPDETRAFLARESPGPKVGEWPSEQPISSGLSVAMDLRSGKALPKVQIAFIPTDDWTTIPAHLRYGDWNDCPPPEIHVAALRAWRDAYGLELIGMSFDTMDLRAAKRPATREDALALAREQYAYCTDIIDQGTQTYSVLAASLMSDDWWFFWWD